MKSIIEIDREWVKGQIELYIYIYIDRDKDRQRCGGLGYTGGEEVKRECREEMPMCKKIDREGMHQTQHWNQHQNFEA